MKREIHIGTSGWHYPDWIGSFYPADIKGYEELRYLSERYDTVENNSSFYRIAGETTYKTWVRMTPDNFRFSMKLNKLVTQTHRLEVNDEVREAVARILDGAQALGEKAGAMLIQLPPSFRADPPRLDAFLGFFVQEIRSREHRFDVAIEFRSDTWFTEDIYELLERHNVALVAAQSSKYPEMRRATADAAYVRLHGPGKLFDSPYSPGQLADWAAYVAGLPASVKRVYVYFNNTMHRYALENALQLRKLLE